MFPSSLRSSSLGRQRFAVVCLCAGLAGQACSEVASPESSGADAGDAASDGSGWDAQVDAGADADAGANADAGDLELSLLSLNLHCFMPAGSAYSDDQQRFEAIAQHIVSLGVGVVALQEACVTPTRDAAKDLASRLEQLTGAAWYSSWQLAHVAWQGTGNEAEEGVALLANRPLEDVRATRYIHQAGLTRIALSGRLAGLDLRVMSVHFDHQDAVVREEQARETAVLALAEAYPAAAVIVAGDFNAKEGSPAHSALTQQGFIDVSDPLAADRIDHVFVHRGTALAATQVGLVLEGADAVSDHPGVLVALSPASPPSVSLTRVRTSTSVGSGELISIRGSVSPLSWDRGWTLRHDESGGTWDFVTSELTGSFEYKLLKDDAVWQTGSNQMGVAGNDHTTSPSF